MSSNLPITEYSVSERPLISVIISLFNKEKYIATTIESVLSQTYHPVELIVIDDGSMDSGAEIARKYTEARVISQENQGAFAARNNGVAESSGDYIAFLDADDLWEKNKLEEQMKVFFSQPSVVVVTTLTQRIDENGGKLGSARKVKIPLDTPVNLYKTLLYEGNPSLNMSSPVIKKASFQSIGGFKKIRLSEDYDFWIRLAAKGYYYYILSKKLTSYRILMSSKLHGSLEREYGALLDIYYIHKNRYSFISGHKRLSKIYYEWADSAFFSDDPSCWFAVKKSLYFNPLNFKLYFLVFRWLIKRLLI